MTNVPKLIHVLLSSEKGGCERNAYVLCNHLKSFVHEVIILGCRGPMSNEWDVAGTAVKYVDAMKLSRGQRINKIKGVFGALDASGVILWHGMAELPALLYALSRNAGPILIHGGNPASGCRSWTDFRYLMMERKWPHSHDPIYVCCSNYVAESFDRSRYLRRFRRCVIHNGVEHESAIVHHPRKLSSNDSITIGMMARLDRIKDHPTLIRSMAEVSRTIPKARLELAGDGEEMATLQELVRSLGLEHVVRFLGSISNVYETLSKWDVFAYAATPREGFGNAVAEALMCGLPTVVSDLPPLREVCGSNQTVRFVRPDDPKSMASVIVHLIENYSARQQLSAAARRWGLRELSAEVYAARYAALLAGEQNRLTASHAASP